MQKEKFKTKLTNYCKILNKFRRKKDVNPLKKLILQYKNKKYDFYEFIDKMNAYNNLLHRYSEYLEQIDLAKIEISQNKVVYITKKNNIKLSFDGKDMRGVPYEILNWGEYERTEKKVLEKIIHNPTIIFDIGANIGWYSLLFAKNYTKARIYSFEPIKYSYNFCLENIHLNNIHNIKLYNYGLSNKNGIETFFFSPETSALASNKNIIGYKNVKRCDNKVLTLDSFVDLNNISEIDFIKCDVEGAELKVLEGALESIKKFQSIIFLELFHEWSKLYDYHPMAVFKLLFKLGYEAFLPSNGKLKKVCKYVGTSFSKQNYIFLSKTKHKDLIKKNTI